MEDAILTVQKSSTFHCLDHNCVRRCNKSSGFYLFTTRIWLYCCTGFFFFPLDEDEEVLIWSSWPVCMCVCVHACRCVCGCSVPADMSGSVAGWGGSEVVRRSTARMYDTSGVCVHVWTLFNYLSVIVLVTMMHNLGRSFREGVNETSALAKPWTLISSLCNSSVLSLCVRVPPLI